MVQTVTINPATFSGAKFAERYSLTRFQYRVIGETTLEYPDALPAPGSVVIETNDPIETIVLKPKYLSTPDATPVVVISHAIPTNSAVEIQGIVTAISGTSCAKWWGLAQMKRAGGNAVLVGAANIIIPIKDVALVAADVAISASTTNGVITVTGIGATVQWIVELRARIFRP